MERMINVPNFEVNNVSVSTLLGFVSDGTIASRAGVDAFCRRQRG